MTGPGDHTTADLLEVRGIEIFAHHGVFDHERKDGQTFYFDLGLELDTRRAAETDDLADTVDYGSLVQEVVAEVQGAPANLIEKVAQSVADICLARPMVQHVRVTIHKPQAPIPATFSDVALTVRRSRDD